MGPRSCLPFHSAPTSSTSAPAVWFRMPGFLQLLIDTAPLRRPGPFTSPSVSCHRPHRSSADPRGGSSRASALPTAGQGVVDSAQVFSTSFLTAMRVSAVQPASATKGGRRSPFDPTIDPTRLDTGRRPWTATPLCELASDPRRPRWTPQFGSEKPGVGGSIPPLGTSF